MPITATFCINSGLQFPDEASRISGPHLSGRNIFGNDGTRPDDSSVADSHRFANDRIHSDKDTLADNDPAGAEISGERIVIMGQNGRSGSDQRMVSDGDVFRTKRIETYAGPYENIAFRGGGEILYPPYAKRNDVCVRE